MKLYRLTDCQFSCCHLQECDSLRNSRGGVTKSRTVEATMPSDGCSRVYVLQVTLACLLWCLFVSLIPIYAKRVFDGGFGFGRFPYPWLRCAHAAGCCKPPAWHRPFLAAHIGLQHQQQVRSSIMASRASLLLQVEVCKSTRHGFRV